jgi:CRISPR-associated protein Cas2
MVILILERVPTSLRGELSRWLIEPKAGVFLGMLSALVRDKLWEKVCADCRDGAALLVHSGRTEQGFHVRTHGDASRHIVDVEGLMLVRTPAKETRRRPRRAKGGVDSDEVSPDNEPGPGSVEAAND